MQGWLGPQGKPVIVFAATVAALVSCAIVLRWLARKGEATGMRWYFAAAASVAFVAAAATWAWVERNAERTGWDLALGVLALVYFVPRFTGALQRFGQRPPR